MQKTVVLDGELSLLVSGQADCELLVPEGGEVGTFMAMRQVYPIYDGPMEITPSAETQTLSTTLKSVVGDIVINPIPNNYGLIEWNGLGIRVS